MEIDWTLIRDIFVSVIAIAMVAYIVWVKINEHPSDKYHNDSWKNRRKK